MHGLTLVALMIVLGQASADPTQIQYLSGIDKDNTVLWNFTVSGGRNAGIATNVPVPSCWETMGFGTYQYGRAGNWNNAESGTYSYTFSVPPAWAGKRVFLVFEGVFTDTSVTVNGQSVGPTHQGGYYEFRYEITPFVIFGGNNALQATVSKYSANASINNAERHGDYWTFGGIFRPVYLEAKPQACIDRIATDARANGQITVNTYLSGITSTCTLNAFVTDTNGVQQGGAFTAPVSPGVSTVALSASLPTPNPWSAEFPTLYNLTVQLLDGTTEVHTVTNPIGFRTITFTNNVGFFVNGRKVVMRGVCRHEFWPDTGRTVSRAVSDLDIGLMKDMNFNAVRMSHYPPNKLFLEECDRLGLYILDELAGWQAAYDNTVASNLVYQMVIRDVNHPCVIAWDNGNEGGHNTTVDQNGTGTTNVYGIWDPQNRKVLRPTTGSSTAFNGVVTYHYTPYSTFIGLLGAGKTVCMNTELLHAIYDGGGGASLQEYWDAMRTAPNGGGIFLWAFLDEGVVRTDLGGSIDVSGQSAPDGIVGPYRQKEASYYAYKAIWSPVQIVAPNPATFTGTLAVSNRFDFTDLSQCTFNWQLGWFPDAGDPASNFTNGFLVAWDSGSFAGPSLPPGTSGSMTLNLPAYSTNYDALRLAAVDPFGNNIYTWTWPLHASAQIRDRILGLISTSAPSITAGTNGTEIVVTNGPRVFHFSSTNGVLISLTVSNQPVSLSNGPRPVIGTAWTVTSITNYSDGTNFFVTVNDPASSANAFQWCIRPDGWVKLNYRYTLNGSVNYLGVTFDYPSNKVTSMNWLGQGPYRVWKNRLAGQEVFVHTKTINNTWTGQSSGYNGWVGTQWTYPEFSGYHGQLNWATLQTAEQPITIVTPTPNLFLRVLTPTPTDIGNDNPAIPSGAISLLHGISPIGNKFDAPSATGPAGQLNAVAGLYTGEANWFFGPLPASGADRDGNGLTDAWELAYFNTLGQDPNADPNGDGLSLFVENAFDLSPTNSSANSPRLPHFTAGTGSPAALAYRVPLDEADFFSFIPQISGDLLTWYGADAHPEYFVINSSLIGSDTAYSVEPNLSNWPGNTNDLFLRLQIGRKKW